jgi:hypothetical protein
MFFFDLSLPVFLIVLGILFFTVVRNVSIAYYQMFRLFSRDKSSDDADDAL